MLRLSKGSVSQLCSSESPFLLPNGHKLIPMGSFRVSDLQGRVMRVRCPDVRNGCEKLQQELGAELRLSTVLGRYRSRVSRARQNRPLSRSICVFGKLL